jgi:hypothetical protein
MVLATVDTGKFYFTMLAETESAAIDGLLAAWRRHCTETGAHRDYMAALIGSESVDFTPISVGEVLRDGSVI